MNRNYIWFFPNIWKCFFFNADHAVSDINISGKAIDSPQICLIFIEILSKPCAFLGSKVFIINEISLWVTWKEVILALVLYANGGNELSLFIGVHINTIKSWSRLAFEQTFETNLTLISKGRMVGIFLLYKKMV